MIYQGKTDASLPPLHLRLKTKFQGWHFTCNETHWSDLPTMKALVRRFIEPHRKATVQRLGPSQEQNVIWLIDVWSVHVSKAFRSFMREKFPFILVLYIHLSCTSKFLQDVAVQKLVKRGVQHAFRIFQRKRYKKALDDSAPSLQSDNPANKALMLGSIRMNGHNVYMQLQHSSGH